MRRTPHGLGLIPMLAVFAVGMLVMPSSDAMNGRYRGPWDAVSSGESEPGDYVPPHLLPPTSAPDQVPSWNPRDEPSEATVSTPSKRVRSDDSRSWVCHFLGNREWLVDGSEAAPVVANVVARRTQVRALLRWALVDGKVSHQVLRASAVSEWIALAEKPEDLALIEFAYGERFKGTVVQIQAILALGLVRPEAVATDVMQRLEGLLSDPDAPLTVVRPAAWALGLLGNRNRAVPAISKAVAEILVKALATAESSRVGDIVLALGIQDPASVPSVACELLTAIAKGERRSVPELSSRERGLALVALARLGDPGVLKLASKRVASGLRTKKGDVAELARWAALALGHVGHLSDKDLAALCKSLLTTHRKAKDRTLAHFALLSVLRLAEATPRVLLGSRKLTGQLVDGLEDEALIAIVAGRLVRAARALEGEEKLQRAGQRLSRAMGEQLEITRDRNLRPALLIGMGLTGDPECATALSKWLGANAEGRIDLDVASALLGLALLGDGAMGSLDDHVRALVFDGGTPKETLFGSGMEIWCMAAGSRVDTPGPPLLDVFRDSRPGLQLGAVTLTLARVADDKIIDALLTTVRDEEAQSVRRAYALLALGRSVTSPGQNPYAPLVEGLNYRDLDAGLAYLFSLL